jgi:DNA primase
MNGMDLLRTAIDKKYDLKYLEATGLTIVKPTNEQATAKTFDRFKGRVMFPIHSYERQGTWFWRENPYAG